MHRQIPATHLSTYTDSPQVPCAPCHSPQIEVSHDGTYTVTTASGKVLTGCAVCHGYYEGARGAQVQAAISLTNDTKCTACHSATHPDLNGHKATSSASLACGSCHAGSSSGSMDTKVVHANASAGSCAVCHANGGRVPNIAAKTAECVSCHATETTDYHRTLSVKHASTQSDCGGSGCHALADVGALHSNATTTVAGVTYTGCKVCHQSPAKQPTTTDCKACHSGHGDLGAVHTATMSSACTGCHKATDVRTIHKTKQCASCHNNPAVPMLPANVECATCHTAGAFHVQVDAKHTGLGTSGSSRVRCGKRMECDPRRRLASCGGSRGSPSGDSRHHGIVSHRGRCVTSRDGPMRTRAWVAASTGTRSFP